MHGIVKITLKLKCYSFFQQAYKQYVRGGMYLENVDGVVMTFTQRMFREIKMAAKDFCQLASNVHVFVMFWFHKSAATVVRS